jgi:ABC-type phosphate/phosphonate transport system substrate-binding protein
VKVQSRAIAIAATSVALGVAAMAATPLAMAVEPLVLVVMDPLSKPLSCDCVQGYAQREYKLLGAHLESELGREVKVVWFESLAEALDHTGGKADLVIGKHSVVLADQQATSHALQPLARLTGKDGDVTQKGLIVVRGDDPAETLASLDGYRLLLGPTDAEEKSSAAEAALQKAGVILTGKRERFGACSEAATALLDLPADVKAAAVISSYAEPLLEGCGSINKGDLRVVGETAPVNFITAFVAEEMEPGNRERLLIGLVSAGTKPEVLIGMETLAGFLPWEDGNADSKKKTATTVNR